MWTEQTVAISQVEALLENGYEIEVDSPDGWVGVNYFIRKGIFEEYVLEFEDGDKSVRCNQDHLFETSVGWASAHQLKHGEPTSFLTRDGYKKGTVKRTGIDIPIVDINVNHPKHRYYTENVSSHNTGVGKSLFMCHCAAANMMAGLNVLYITMEMAEERIAERIDANLLDFTLDGLRDVPKDVYQKRLARVKAKTHGKLIVKEYPTASAGSGHFRHLMSELRLKKNFKADVVYIDYLNICMSSRLKVGSNVNSYTYIKAIAEELRGLAVEFNVPIMSATQTTRSGFGNSDVGLEDTSESFGLPATADFMFALISSEELDQLGQILVKQLKNRWGPIDQHKRFMIGIDRSKMKLYDAEISAQDGVVDDRPVMSNTSFGRRQEEDDNVSLFKPRDKKPNYEGFI